MESDWDKNKREQEERRARRRAEIAAISTELEHVLTAPDPDMDPLQRHADLLDCLLYTVMRHNLQSDRRSGYFSTADLELALRIQKQCVDTVKAASAVSYMQSIASVSSGIYPALPAPISPRDLPRALPPHPLPVKNDEPTE